MIYGHDDAHNLKQLCRNQSDFIDIEHGGTGSGNVAGARDNLGLGYTSGAVPVANGGTGASTAAQARANLGITTPTEPADYIVERSESGSWKYEKWNSGFCKIYGNFSPSLAMTTAAGSWYYSTGATISFPFTLKSVYSVQGNLVTNGQLSIFATRTLTMSSIEYNLISPISRTAAVRSIYVTIEGTWK